MLLVTIISMRMISYSRIEKKETSTFDILINEISKISYEIYLVQYPVIFIFQNTKSILKIPSIIVVTFILSIILHRVFHKTKKNKIIQILLCLMLVLTTIYGGIQFIISKDNTKEMKQLEKDLENNRLIIEKRQEEFMKRQQQEQDDWESVLKDIENNEKDLENTVRNLNIVGIGDSIMELAVNDLIKEFPNGYFDAKTNRRPSQVNALLEELKSKNLLSNVILFNVGTNGEFYQKYTDQIMETLGDRMVFWVNATNADYDDFNDRLYALKEKYSNIHIIDWVSVANAHPEYLISDKVHPTVYGCKIYAQTIFQAILKDYQDELERQKEIKLKEHQQEEEKKITFIGNDLLLGLYEYMEEDYPNAKFMIDSNFSYQSLKNKMKEEKMNHNLVFVFDKKADLTSEDYLKLLESYQDYNIFIIDLDNRIKIKESNIKIISIKEVILNDKDNTIDGIHLTEKGNQLLKKIMKEEIPGE